MNRADVRKSQDEPGERPDVEAIEAWMKRRYTGVFVDPVESQVEKLIAYIRALEARQ